MRSSRMFVLAAFGLSLGSALWAAGPTNSARPYQSTPTNPSPTISTGGAMASGSASGFASGNGGSGQTTSKAQAQVQIGGMPGLGSFPQIGSPGEALNGNMPANLINLNPNQLINPAALNPAGINPRATATINSGEDKIITGADNEYSTVIKVKPNGQITMIVVTMATMEVRRAQAQNVDELRKKDKLAYTEFLKYTETE